jgi:hypothetical protein
MCGIFSQRATVTWRDVWIVVKTSALRRLGRPLLVAYLALAIFGIAVVGVAVVVMHM